MACVAFRDSNIDLKVCCAFRKMIKLLFTLKTRNCMNYAGIHTLCHAYFVESLSKELINLCMIQSKAEFLNSAWVWFHHKMHGQSTHHAVLYNDARCALKVTFR